MTLTLVQKAQSVAFFLFIFGATLLTAQTHSETEAHRCGTPPMTADQIRYTLDVVAKQVVLRNAGMTCVPIQAFIVREDNGSGGMTYDQLNKGLANLNYLYYPANIEFYWANVPQYANNSDYAIYDPLSKGHTKAGLKALFNDAQTALSIYFTKSLRSSVSGNIIGGYSQGPGNDVETNFIHMEYAAFTYSVWSTGAHEMGHYFNLAHTFDYTESGNAGVKAENVARSGVQKNCDVAGDFVCDTDADPKYSTSLCNNIGNAAGNLTDRFGVAYTPPFNNLMSYYDYACRNDNVVTLTLQQYTRIAQALATRLTHTAYRLNASPMNVNNPSGLAAVQQNALAVVLTWTDNANNEMGYLIERSTASNNSGFKVLKFGSTTDNITTFTDNDVVPNTTYYYRIKASNDDCNDYSNVVTITPQPAYCIPNYTTTCALDAGGTPMFLEKFTLKTSANAILFNNDNNNCASAVSDFTSNALLSANVTAGTIYNFEVRVGRKSVNGSFYYNSQDIGIWLDINNDKDFDDAGENLGIFSNLSTSLLSSSFTIPANTTNGARRLRIRSTPKNTGMTSASICSNFSHGETEDYTLNVSGGAVALPVRLTRFQGKNTEGSNQLTWRTESEVNAAYFDVERSVNGQNFEKVTTVKAFGKANTYVLDDKNTTQNTPYYRLKMVDNDGSFDYSKIITLRSDKNNNSLIIYPNPVTQFLIIETTEEGDQQVINLLGQIVLRSKATQQMDVSALPSGTYVLKIGGQQARFTKQ